jgi:DNA topoisomerase-1
VTLRSGRFGPYVQLGDGEKPKRASIPKGWAPDSIDLEAALKLLSLPREVGTHPESGKPIVAGIGRYGPFVEHDGKYANLDSVDEVFTVGANRAVALLAEKKSGGRQQRTAAVLKELGEHPALGGPVTVRSGRFGPYVNHGKLNATLPKSVDPDKVTLEQAVELLAEKQSKAGAGKAAGKAPARKRAAPRKPRAQAAE